MPYQSFGQTKPPMSGQISWGHPLAWRLVLAYPFNEGAGTFVFNNACWNANPPGPAAGLFANTFKDTTGLVYQPTATATLEQFWQPGLLNGTGLTFTAYTVDEGILIAGQDPNTGKVAYDTVGLPYSMQAWVRFAGDGYNGFGNTGPTIMGRMDAWSTSDFHCNISVNHKSHHLQRFSTFDSQFTIKQNQIYHIVYTFDAAGGDTVGNETFYVNAQKVATQHTTTLPATLTGRSNLFQIGSTPSGFWPWNGQIDWPCMWINRVLSQSDVEWLYAEPWAIYPIALHRRAFYQLLPPTGRIFLRQITDVVGISETITTLRYKGVLVTDAIGIAETIARTVASNRLILDVIGIAEVISRNVTALVRKIIDALGVGDTMAQIINIMVGSCCPCQQSMCNGCVDKLPDTLYATVNGSGTYCQCIGTGLVIPLLKKSELCDPTVPCVTKGWTGIGNIDCSETQLQINFCCCFLPPFNNWFWLLSVQSLPCAPTTCCKFSGFTTPGTSCIPLNEGLSEVNDAGFHCCNPLSNDPANPDRIQITITQ